MADWRLDVGGEGSFGEREDISMGGEPLLEFGGVKRVPPLRTWQVGQTFTNREINSLGTLWGCQLNRLSGLLKSLNAEQNRSCPATYHEYICRTWAEVLSRPPCWHC